MEGRSSDCEKEIIQGIKSMMDYRKWNWIMAPKIKTVETKAGDDFFSSVVVAAIYKIELLK